ncbi:MAG TPA: efflux RND transporter periplasmic adaptor subunit [Dokdonella sp.]|nr:efflux RND transporter periplasmic adaptor subunit [Dokdonella sp.]
MMRRVLALALIASSILAACSDAPESEPGVVAVANVRVVAAENRPLHATLEAFGTTMFAPESLHSVAALAEVRIERVLVSAGEPIRREQVLLVVAPTAATQLERIKAQADLDYSSQQLARQTALRKQELATNADVASARLAHANARAALDDIESRIGDSHGQIRADRDGLVAAVDVQQGAIVTTGTTLLQLADRADLRVRLGIEPKDFADLREGQQVTLAAIYDAGIKADARIGKLVGRIDPQSRLAEALVDIDAGSALLPGTMVKASILLDAQPDAVAVPRSAVLYADRRAYVFIVRNGKAIRTWVETGAEDNASVQILSGVSPGDAIVVEGNYELSDGMAVKVEVPPK